MSARLETWLQHWLQQQQLAEHYAGLVTDYFSPLADKIAAFCRDQPPKLIAINGAQGTGKSTLSTLLQTILVQRYQLNVALLSIDDFYLPRRQRELLALDCHPLLGVRGVPGTHEVALAIKVIQSLLAGHSTMLPRFNKAIDDRMPCSHWQRQQQTVDLVIFEGWCVAAKPQPEDHLKQPINTLEKNEDSDGRWRRYVNRCLAGDYQDLFAMIDFLVMLKAPSMEAVLEWRWQQEQQLSKQVAGQGKGLMNYQEVARFIQYYERLTRHQLAEMPSRADVVFSLNPDHRVITMHEREHGL